MTALQLALTRIRVLVQRPALRLVRSDYRAERAARRKAWDLGKLVDAAAQLGVLPKPADVRSDEIEAFVEIYEALLWRFQAPHTQAQVAELLGVPQQKVNRLEKRALMKMRTAAPAEFGICDHEPAFQRFGASLDRKSTRINSER